MVEVSISKSKPVGEKNQEYIIQGTGHSIDCSTMVIVTEVNAQQRGKENRENKARRKSSALHAGGENIVSMMNSTTQLWEGFPP